MSFFLFEQIKTTEAKIEHELLRKRIVATLDEIQHHHVYSIAAAAFFSVSKDPAVGEKHLAELKQLASELKRLRELTASDPELLDSTVELQKTIMSVVPYEMMMRRLSLMESAPRVDESRKARQLIKESMQLLEAYQAKLLPPVNDINSFKRTAWQLQRELGLALVVVVGLTIVFLYGSQAYVLSALKVLLKQIERFKTGESVVPIIDTGDEIAELEKVLCESANRIVALERVRRELCSIVSHDIRAPMTSVGGLITLLEAGALGELRPEQEMLNSRLKIVCNNLGGVLNDILDLDKLRSGRWSFTVGEHSGDEIKEVVRAQLDSAGISVKRLEYRTDSSLVRCDPEAVARSVVSLVHAFVDEQSTVLISCGGDTICKVDVDNCNPSVEGAEHKQKTALALVRLFCEQQNQILIVDTESGVTLFCIRDTGGTSPLPVDTTSTDGRIKKSFEFSQIGLTLLMLISRPMAVSAIAVIVLGVVLNQVGSEIAREFVSREIVHNTTRLASDMTHLMLVSIRRMPEEDRETQAVREKIKAKIDSDVDSLKKLESKAKVRRSDELALVENKVDKMKKLSDEMTQQPLVSLGATLKKLLKEGGMTTTVFSKAGSLIADREELESVHAQAMVKLRNDGLIVLIGGSIITALLTILGGVQISRGFIVRFESVADNARRLARNEALQVPKSGDDEIAELDRFFFDVALSIEQLEKERKALSGLLREQLKMPLVALREGFTRLFNDADELSPKSKQLIQRTLAEIQRLNDLADDLLILDSIEQDGTVRLTVSVAATDTSHIVDRSIDAVAPMAAVKKIEFQRMGETNFAVNADSARSVQIIVNLLSNAVKFSPEGGTVKVAVEEDHGMVRIAVIDEGRGIPRSEFDRIFVRFDQVQEIDRTKGSGLGLFISKKLAEAQGGSIDFESTEGSGSTFWLKLQLV
ncbi:MAG: hypothetical protein K2X93_01185 [Candidatus Obscuribacterales bacterium]|nr:hypothetical protein [Candidatus Obscuribacterales bacterium]